MRNGQTMKSVEQSVYTTIMDYIGLNIRSSQLLETTKFKGFAKWHAHEHEAWDDLNKCMTKYLAYQYDIIPDTQMVETYNYPMPNDIRTHLNTWHKTLDNLITVTGEAYHQACTENDLILASIFERMNMHALHTCKHVHKKMKRLKDAPAGEVAALDTEIHRYFSAKE